jgi:hypothetical protein
MNVEKQNQHLLGEEEHNTGYMEKTRRKSELQVSKESSGRKDVYQCLGKTAHVGRTWQSPADVEEDHVVVGEHVADAVAIVSNGAEASSRRDVVGVLFLRVPAILFTVFEGSDMSGLRY